MKPIHVTIIRGDTLLTNSDSHLCDDDSWITYWMGAPEGNKYWGTWHGAADRMQRTAPSAETEFRFRPLIVSAEPCGRGRPIRVGIREVSFGETLCGG